MERISVVEKPWGIRERILEEPNLVIDKLTIQPHKECSIHYHQYKSNTFYIIEGKLLIECYAGYVGPATKTFDILIVPGQKYEIPYMQIHRFVSEHRIVECVEISQGKFVREDDIIRIDQNA